jgi:5-hydroxyisourate hydrolase-like protein (transthyretin family)
MSTTAPQTRIKSIYDINETYIELAELLDELGGELTPEIEEALQINREELEAKVKAYIHIIKIRESNNLAIDLEIERLQGLKQTNLNTIQKLKDVLLETTKLQGYKGKTGNYKLDFDTVKLYTAGSKAVEITDITKLPEEYRKYSIIGGLNYLTVEKILTVCPNLEFQYEAKKSSIKDDLTKGVVTEIPGIFIKDNESIRIK